VRLVRYGDEQVGCVLGGLVVDVTAAIPASANPMRTLIESWEELAGPVAERAAAGAAAGTPPAEAGLLAPLRPEKVLAAPANYRDHTAEMVELVGTQVIERFKGFLKSPSSVVGPGSDVVLPFHDRRFDYEGELGVVIGRRARGVAASAAFEHVFGYLPLLDMTMRGEEDRSFRKSFDTFTPIGPELVTADEVTDAGDLELKLWRNDELLQDANTSDLVWDIPKLIEVYSSVITLEPGDVIATGTPAGIGPVTDGDRLRLTIAEVGTLEVSVLESDSATSFPEPGAE
jgi:2-keto-4-pentenoate hydratase/2-oxohepta-3-ene-1,7-dioic acid hydratase in catechol pathway